MQPATLAHTYTQIHTHKHGSTHTHTHARTHTHTAARTPIQGVGHQGQRHLEACHVQVRVCGEHLIHMDGVCGKREHGAPGLQVDGVKGQDLGIRHISMKNRPPHNMMFSSARCTEEEEEKEEEEEEGEGGGGSGHCKTPAKVPWVTRPVPSLVHSFRMQY